MKYSIFQNVFNYDNNIFQLLYSTYRFVLFFIYLFKLKILGMLFFFPYVTLNVTLTFFPNIILPN